LPEITEIGVVGAGLMGSGIAESAARAGVRVTIHEPDSAVLDRARGRMEASLERQVSRGRLDAAEASATLERIQWSTDLEDFRSAGLAIEAVFEDEDVKTGVFTALDRVMAPEAILASNTSSIPIAGLAAKTGRADRVCGLHFFSPVPVMDLVEVVIALETSQETLDAVLGFAERIGKRPIRTKDRAGFVVNTLLVPYLMSAVRMYEDGFATLEDIDEGMKLGCGHPMGPMQLCDFIGLDVLEAVCDSLFDEFKRPDYAAPAILKRMVVSGRLGRKTGRGFYDYSAA
jgi:3-hydroxybutyryl-CoA dehydrogenase